MGQKSFVLLDLVSQGLAVQRKLAGLPLEQKLQWIAQHGNLRVRQPVPERPPYYLFTSRLGFVSGFVFDGDELILLGDHHAFTPREYVDLPS